MVFRMNTHKTVKEINFLDICIVLIVSRSG